MSRHYLDYASSAPLRPEANQAIRDWLDHGAAGDPGRPHEDGRAVAAAIEASREALAVLVGVRPRQVIFTSGGTEAVNWANVAARELDSRRPIAYSAVEHSAVRLSAERLGAVSVIGVDEYGHVDTDALTAMLSDSASRPCLVHCQYANHEVGTLQPIRDVIALCRAHGVAVHVDACSAIGQLPIDLGTLDADLVSVSGHKFGAPSGIGALVLRRGVRVRPLLVGGEQERARRAGMEAILPIIGLGAVADALSSPGALDTAADRARELTERIVTIAHSVDGVVSYGDPVARLPHLVCFGVGGVEAEGVVLGLDRAGLSVHSGSACSSESIEPSPVLAAMGVDADRSLRCSVGWNSSDEDVDAFAASFPAVVRELRALSS